jgi:rhodanese-related sulfurtransferase
LPNPVYALENGTQGWTLADLDLEHEADRLYPRDLDQAAIAISRRRAEGLIETYGLTVVDQAQLAARGKDETRSLYWLDVRTPEEFAAAHHPLAENAPGGQLVQATDKWIAVRNARIALLDDTGLRAALTALWLRAMGHRPEIVRTQGAPTCWPPGRDATLAPNSSPLPVIAPAELKRALDRDEAQVIDLRSSSAFRRSHIAGARWSIRPRLDALVLEPRRPVVLTAETPGMAALAATDLREMGHEAVVFLGSDEAAWAKAGLALEKGGGPADAKAIDTLLFVHDRHDGNKAAMRAYLSWEIGLVAQLDAQERAVFNLEPLIARPPA